jgi:predicted small integral membrane protein
VTIRTSKALLLFALAFYYTLVVFNNIDDYHSNLNFVQHVLQMDTTFAGNKGMWRAVYSPAVMWTFFISIVVWETAITGLLWFAAVHLVRNLRKQPAVFNMAKKPAIVALTMSLLMWLVFFLTVGSEWFLMWQSKQWSGQAAAFSMFAVVGILLLYIAMPDVEGQA